jgi:hypothetical protein
MYMYIQGKQIWNFMADMDFLDVLCATIVNQCWV